MQGTVDVEGTVHADGISGDAASEIERVPMSGVERSLLTRVH
jgi:hypothetical protein